MESEAWIPEVEPPWGTLEWQQYCLKRVLAERERCAKVAEGEKVEAEITNCTDDVVYNLACDHIAAAIRSGE